MGFSRVIHPIRKRAKGTFLPKGETGIKNYFHLIDK